MRFYEENERKRWHPVEEDQVGAFGEVEKSAILFQGAILTGKRKLKENVLKQIKRQLLAEEEDRMIED